MKAPSLKAARLSAPCFVALLIKALAPLDHLIGESVPLSIDAVSSLRILQHARNSLAQLELDVGKGGAALTLVLNVLAHRFAEGG